MALTQTIAPKLRRAVVAGLRDHLGGLEDFEAVEVSYGFTFASARAEKVYLGPTRSTTPPTALRPGRNIRAEAGGFDVHVMVRLAGEGAEATEDRGFAIGAEIEDWTSLRKSGEGLGVTGLQTLLISGWNADYAAVEGGTGFLLVYTLAWTARLEGTP